MTAALPSTRLLLGLAWARFSDRRQGLDSHPGSGRRDHRRRIAGRRLARTHRRHRRSLRNAPAKWTKFNMWSPSPASTERPSPTVRMPPPGFPAFAPSEERKKTGLTGEKIIADLRAKFADIQEAVILVLPPPSVRGIGSGGFKLMLQDRANLGTKALEDAATRLVAAANGDPAIAQAFSPFSREFPAAICRCRSRESPDARRPLGKRLLRDAGLSRLRLCQ